MRPYLAQIKSNLLLMARDRSVLFFSVLFPLIFFFIFAQSFDAGKSSGAMVQVIASVLIIGILGNGFFGAGIRTVQDRETNILRRFKVAPISPLPMIVSSLVSGLVNFLPVLFLILIFGKLLYHAPLPSNLLSLITFVSIGILSFRSMGMIIASVVNSAQEGNVLVQILYLPMLFLSGATFPISAMPIWVQTMAQFLPATYLYQGISSIMIDGESLWANSFAVVALVITMSVALFIGVKLFRWEKEEKVQNKAKLWIVAVLAPFFVLGVYQARTRENITKARMLARSANRHSSTLFQNAKIFVGDGRVIENGAVLVRNGKIISVFDNLPKDTASFNAQIVDLSGKTLIPGLIDMHVHLGSPGGVYKDERKYADPNADRQRLAAYLYSGITAVRSTGDFLDNTLKLCGLMQSGQYLGAELFLVGRSSLRKADTLRNY
jgi:ABC-type multidrug transport system permease subunit